MASKFDRYVRNVPKLYKPKTNPNIRALLKAWSEGDDDVVDQIKNTKSQLFVRTATGEYLNRLASSYGVSRPTDVNLSDEEFQELVPNLSLKPKQIRKTFYDTMDVFWGPLFSRANLDANNDGPYNVSPGDVFKVIVDGEEESRSIKATADDIASPGSATSEEVAAILDQIDGITASVIEEQVSGTSKVNIRTNTPGPRGSVEVVSSSMVSSTKLDFDLRRVRITDLNQRTVLYQLRNKELIIELPSIVPSLRRTLKGSHHFHENESSYSGSGNWVGSFLYDPGGNDSFTVTQKKATLQQNIVSGTVVPTLTVSGADDIPNAPGKLIFDFGSGNEEQPVDYIGRPNSNTLLIDPGYTFTQNHSSGESVNLLALDLKPYTPDQNGEDLAVYLTSPAGARQTVQDILKQLVAVGVVINFFILLPEYTYSCGNPYA